MVHNFKPARCNHMSKVYWHTSSRQPCKKLKSLAIFREIGRGGLKSQQPPPSLWGFVCPYWIFEKIGPEFFLGSEKGGVGG